MKVTRQRSNTERRLVITLARHERHLTKTEILSRIKKQKNNIEIAKEFGANVYHEIGKKSAQFLYMIPAHDFHKKGDQITPAQVAELGDYVNQLREQRPHLDEAIQIVHRARHLGAITSVNGFGVGRAINTRADELKPDKDGFYSPRLNPNE